MQNSKCIVSINHTSGAPIFDISHYGVVGDYKSVVPAIIEEIKRRKARTKPKLPPHVAAEAENKKSLLNCKYIIEKEKLK